MAEVVAASLVSLGVVATADPALPSHGPTDVEIPDDASFVTSDGRVRVVGYNDMRDLLEALATRFNEAHPGITFELDLRGTRYAPAALARGASAFAPMGAVFTPGQLADYRRQQPLDPACFRVAHASLDPAALSGPLAVFVNEDNPLQSLSLEQLRGVFAGAVRTWGELGLAAPWAGRAITGYGLREGTALWHEFSALVMGEEDMAPTVTWLPQSAEVVDRVVSDPGGIGFAAAMRVKPGARVVPLRPRPDDQSVLPTRTTLAEGRYPLDRFLYICVTRPMPAVAREFLRLMLSRDGQQAVAATPQRYIPLSATDAAAEHTRLARLDAQGAQDAAVTAGGK